MQSLTRKLLRDLLHMRGQVIAIVLIVACGIASLVTMMSAYESLKLSQEAYYEQYRFAEVFASLKRAPEPLSEQIRQITDVQTVQTRVVMDVTLDVPGLTEPAVGRLISVPEDRQPQLNQLFIRQGRYLQPGRREEVLVSEAFAIANNLSVGDALGAVINGRWQALRIVGIALTPEYVYEIRGTDILPDNRRFGVFWMGREALGTAFDMKGAFNDVTLDLVPGANQAEVIFRLDQLLEPYGGLGAVGRQEQLSNQFLSDEIQSLKATAVFVPVIFLGIAAFLLNLLLARLISTQRDQIAVLKAFGYDNWAVGLHYLALVMVVVLAGATVGTGVGLWFGATVTRYYTNFYHFPVLRYEAGIGLMVLAVGVSAIAALMGAFSAVRHAVSLPPAEAMRPEPPASYQPTVLERLGLQRLFSPVGRIILRNLERRPIQAGMSILGIALAVSILVVGRYFNDCIQYIVDVQFRTLQREDMTLVFNQPTSSRARYDLEHLPGVMQVEPFRAVSARLRFEHRSKRLGIQGLLPNSDLRNLLDRNLNPVPLPPEGIVLSKKLAEILAVEVGDTLTIEVLEQNRPVRQTQVMGLVDELVGISAYMDIAALNRLMQEGRVISGAYLKVDDAQLEALYQAVKETPAIASVGLRKTLIARFNETIAGSLGIFTTVLVIFSCVIAFGVVYNAARIALSERGRELATLRIIGFSQGEISVVLLGEQAILTALAIPVGWGMGFGLAALMSATYDTELYRLPLVVPRSTFAFAFVVIALAALVSGWIIRRQLYQLDLVAVLKTRE